MLTTVLFAIKSLLCNFLYYLYAVNNAKMYSLHRTLFGNITYYLHYHLNFIQLCSGT